MLDTAKQAEQLFPETKQFALALAKFVCTLPDDRVTHYYANQVLSFGTSVGGYCRRAAWQDSPYQFRAELHHAASSCDAARYYLELLLELELSDRSTAATLQQQADSLLRTISAVIDSSQNK